MNKKQDDQWEPYEISQRLWEHTRDQAIGDIFYAFVELITNCDDSYHRLYIRRKREKDGGPILIKYKAARGNKSSQVVVCDRAEGMTIDEMRNKLKKPGEYSSDISDRGFYGRGAKDCTKLGELIYESIKDDRYYKCILDRSKGFKALAKGFRVTEEIRKDLNIDHGNGTTVTLTINPGIVNIPQYENLISKILFHYALRDILSEFSETSVKIINENNPAGKPDKLICKLPPGELVCDETFKIEGYDVAEAILRIWRSEQPFEGAENKFAKHGILIKDIRAIHDRTVFREEFKKDPNIYHYFGRLECSYIDILLREYEENRKIGKVDPQNPTLLVLPTRQHGLDSNHPFTSALFKLPIERLGELLRKDRKETEIRKSEIANNETKKSLSKLAKAASKFFQERLDEISELGSDEEIDEKAFTKTGIIIYPTFKFKLGIGKTKNLTVYAKKSLINEDTCNLQISSDVDAINILQPEIILKQHKKRPDRLIAGFKIQGVYQHDAVHITATNKSLPEAHAMVQVGNYLDERDFNQPFEFEFNSYKVKENKKRKIKLFAKFPEVVQLDKTIKIISSNNDIPILGNCVLHPIEGTNYAVGEVGIQGRRLNAVAEITALLNGYKAVSSVKIVEKNDEEEGINFDFQLKDEDYGNRAIWAVHENKPYLLLISGRHDSIKRYLGPPPDYKGQELPLFRVLLAEIIANSVCTKLLRLEAEERGWEFEWSEEKPEIIADKVSYQLELRMRDFVSIAHKILLANPD